MTTRSNIIFNVEDINQASCSVANPDLPTVSYKLVGRTTTDTLFNKTITDSSNNITAKQLAVPGYSDISAVGSAILPGYVPRAISSTQFQWQNGTFAAPNVNLTVFVDKSGSDSVGDGTAISPFASIAKALSVITNASTTNRYIINVGSGRFDESALVLKPWIWIIGQQRTATRVTSTQDLILDASFASGSHRFGFKDILLSGSNGVNFDLQTLGGSGGVVFESQSFYVNNKFIYKCRTSADFLESWNSQYSGGGGATYSLEFYGGALIMKNNFLQTDVLVSDVGTSGDLYCGFYDNYIGGNLTFNRTRSSTYQCETGNTMIFGAVLTLNNSTGGSLQLSSDGDSLPATISTTGSVNLIKTTTAVGIAYTPAVGGQWTTTPTSVSNALDQLVAGTNQYVGVDNALTARAGGGQALATPITKYLTRVTTVATAGDSMLLPVGTTGRTIVLRNDGANSLNLFPSSGQIIGALSANASTAVAAANTIRLSYTGTNWIIY